MKMNPWVPGGIISVALLLIVIVIFSTCGGCGDDDSPGNSDSGSDTPQTDNGGHDSSSNGGNPNIPNDPVLPIPTPVPVISIPFDHSYRMGKEESIKVQLFEDWTGWIRMNQYTNFNVDPADSMSFFEIEFGDMRRLRVNWKNKDKIRIKSDPDNKDFRLRGQGEAIITVLGRTY